MKTFVYILTVWCLLLFACKKQNITTDSTLSLPARIFFTILDKNGNNIIHSANDSLVVTYVQNGVTLSSRLDIFNVQISSTDATPVSKYNGFVISDWIPNTVNYGYMSTASSDLQSYSSSYQDYGTRNFDLYLNGIHIGSVYFDYWGTLILGFSVQSYPTFTLNSTAATIDKLPGFLTAGYPAMPNESVLTINSGLDPPHTSTPYSMYVLQYNGVIANGN